MSGLEALTLALGAGQSILGGIAQNKAAKFEAKQLEARGKEDFAAGQRRGVERRRDTERLLSRQRAVAAASGGGVTNASVLDILENTQARGDFLIRSEIAAGEQRNRGRQDQAAARRFGGRQARIGGFLGAGGTVLKGIAKSRFG